MARTHPTDSGNLVLDSLTLSGDATISGNLDVAGSTTLVSATTSGAVTIDLDNTEALLVRKDGDAGDIFTVDTIAPLISTTSAINVNPASGALLSFKSGVYGQFRASADDGLLLTAGTDTNSNRNIIITDTANAAFDHGHDTLSPGPTLFIHSVNATTNEWGSLSHDGTRFNIESGKTVITMVDFAEMKAGMGINSANTTLLRFDSGTDDGVRMSILGNDGLDNKNLIFTKLSNKDSDHDHDTISTDPTLFIHSATDPDNSNSEYVSFEHDKSNSTFSTGLGGFAFDIDVQPARGTMVFSGQPSAGDNFVVNATTFTEGAEWSLGVDLAATLAAIVAEINTGAESANAHAYDNGVDTVTVEWLTKGTAGNSIVFTTTLDTATIDGAGTLGGAVTGVAANPGVVLIDNSGKMDASISGINSKISVANVSSPPTDAELDSEFGTPATVGPGFTAILDDNGAGTAVYLIASDGTNWWHQSMTKAV